LKSLPLEEVLRRARAAVADVIAPSAARIDREACWPAEGFRSLLDAGLGGLVVPQAAGGLGLGLVGLARVCEEVGRACPSTAISFGMHHVAAAVIGAKAVVDDELDTRELIGDVLTGCGATVSLASSVAEALQREDQTRPSVIVSDIALQAGFQMHVAKPVEPDELVAVVVTLARMARLMQ
jgi:alkylation response protein AidB-like acyl-CoA dehydrogenase